MAKITVTLNTETKEFSADVDGEVIENVRYLSISPPDMNKDRSGDQYYHVCIEQSEKLENGLTKYSELRAYGSEKFEVSTEDALAKSIASFLLPDTKKS